MWGCDSRADAGREEGNGKKTSNRVNLLMRSDRQMESMNYKGF